MNAKYQVKRIGENLLWEINDRQQKIHNQHYSSNDARLFTDKWGISKRYEASFPIMALPKNPVRSGDIWCSFTLKDFLTELEFHKLATKLGRTQINAILEGSSQYNSKAVFLVRFENKSDLFSLLGYCLIDEETFLKVREEAHLIFPMEQSDVVMHWKYEATVEP